MAEAAGPGWDGAPWPKLAAGRRKSVPELVTVCKRGRGEEGGRRGRGRILLELCERARALVKP